MGMNAVGGATGTQISPKVIQGCDMAPPATTPPATPPVDQTKGGGPLDTSDASKGAIAGAAGGGPTADAVGGASQLTALQDVLSQLSTLIQQLTTLLAGQVGGGGPVQQVQQVQQVDQVEQDSFKGGKADQTEDSDKDFGEMPAGIVAGANGSVPQLPDEPKTTVPKVTPPPVKSGGATQTGGATQSGGPKQSPPPAPAPKPHVPSPVAIAAAKAHVAADKAAIAKATSTIAEFKADLKKDNDRIAALTDDGKMSAGTVAELHRLEHHRDGLAAGIHTQEGKLDQARLTLERDEIALKAVSK
jgi:hypothetical protein